MWGQVAQLALAPGVGACVPHHAFSTLPAHNRALRSWGSIVSFVACLVCLQVFKCYMDLNDAALKDFAKAATAGETVDMRSPIKEADYSTHAGAVRGLECSPFQVRQVVASCRSLAALVSCLKRVCDQFASTHAHGHFRPIAVSWQCRKTCS